MVSLRKSASFSTMFLKTCRCVVDCESDEPSSMVIVCPMMSLEISALAS